MIQRRQLEPGQPRQQQLGRASVASGVRRFAVVARLKPAVRGAAQERRFLGTGKALPARLAEPVGDLGADELPQLGQPLDVRLAAQRQAFGCHLAVAARGEHAHVRYVDGTAPAAGVHAYPHVQQIRHLPVKPIVEMLKASSPLSGVDARSRRAALIAQQIAKALRGVRGGPGIERDEGIDAMVLEQAFPMGNGFVPGLIAMGADHEGLGKALARRFQRGDPADDLAFDAPGEDARNAGGVVATQAGLGLALGDRRDQAQHGIAVAARHGQR